MALKPPWEFDTPRCAGVDPEHFYIEDDGLEFTKNRIDDLKNICNSCVHQIDCAEWGIAKETFGIWGGLSPWERALLRRRRRALINKNLLSTPHK
jgi:hypothetical protein